MAVKPVSFGPFIKGVDASTGVLTQPKGSVPRASNMIFLKRGALKTCDGSLIVNAYNGVPTAGRGRAMCEFFFEPTGVAPYYLRILSELDQPIAEVQNIVAGAGTGSGSGLAAGTYYYLVTALDGVGGETNSLGIQGSVTITAGQNIPLTWDVVPNAAGYNVYRGDVSFGEILLQGLGLPVPQPSSGSTVSFTDTGFSPAAIVLPVSQIALFGDDNNLVFTTPQTLSNGTVGVYAAGSNPAVNGAYTITGEVTSTRYIITPRPPGSGSTGGTFVIGGTPPPVKNTTRQTALYAMPPSGDGIAYTDANIVALFPASTSNPPGGSPGGGTRPGNTGVTPSGGIQGLVNLIPQMVQFTNQAVIALGNGFAPQVYSDPNGTPTNPAFIGVISAISVDAFGVVTITTTLPHGINATQGVGANVYLKGITVSGYNTNGNGISAFTTIAIPSTTSVKVYNPSAIGLGASSGGTMTVTTIPIISTFVPAYPVWTTAVSYAVNSIIVPTVSNGHYYKAIQSGTSGGTQPTFPIGTGARVSDGSIIWQEAGLINTAAPPPPGAGHIAVYSGSLWVLNTWVANTTNGLDGPTCLRMSDVNNLNSWNPINQAFLDKDDGTEGMGLAAFTITAQGIPPEGSLVATKQYATYQIVGVFGSPTFAIQRAETDMGCIAPRTLQFIPGFGIGRISHLGFAIFDGVNDRIVSSQIQPYLFASDDPDVADIVPMDSAWMSVSQSAQTSNPPMYVTSIPVGSSGGALTRICCFDLVLKAWAIVDLPFPVSTMLQVRTAVSPVVTLFGSFSDGTLQRWQATDQTWATASAGSGSTAPVSWSVRPPTVASKDPDERLYLRRIIVRGQQNSSTLIITPRVAGVAQAPQPEAMPVSGDYAVQAAVGIINDRFDAIISGQGQVTIDAIGFHLEPRPVGVLAGAIS